MARARRLRTLALIAALAGLAGLALPMTAAPLRAQSATAAQSAEPAVLVADDIVITADRRLVASGNVEAFRGTTRLTASAITYDPAAETLTITGPITIDDGAGVVILASQAELSRDLENGLLVGARLVLDDQLQLAAVRMNRVNGRYTQLYKTAVTSCRICENDPRPPLWQIRATRIVHDEEARQLYFDNAQLLWRDVPIFYLPQLRMPDPTLERATGFLFPQVQSNSLLGTGVKLPYFIKLGDHRDLTLTPYLTNRTRTLEYRYRQAFRRGDLVLQGAQSDDDLQPNDARGFLFGAGRFALPRGFRLDFDFETVSDDSYLSDYGYFGRDRLDSELRVSRTQRDAYTRLSIIIAKTLRDDEIDEFLPSDIYEAEYIRRFFPRAIGGEITLGAVAHAHLRRSGNPGDSTGDGIADGRDIRRVNVALDWRRTDFAGGLRVTRTLGLLADTFDVQDDLAFEGRRTQITPRAAIALRYPLIRRGTNGVRTLIEPMVQLAWTGGDGLDIPNEEATEVEFDEGNLLALSRFAAPDRRERGWAAALGLSYARFAPGGWSTRLTLGQIVRQDPQLDFTASTGLAGLTSDVLVSGQIKHEGGLSLAGRTLFDDNLEPTRAEIRGAWGNRRFDLAGSYLWLERDSAAGRAEAINELTFAGAYRFDAFWSANVDWRYDLTEDRLATAQAGVVYTNECIRLAATLTRVYADSTTVEPATNLGFTVSLRGFGTQVDGQRQVRSCTSQAF